MRIAFLAAALCTVGAAGAQDSDAPCSPLLLDDTRDELFVGRGAEFLPGQGAREFRRRGGVEPSDRVGRFTLEPGNDKKVDINGIQRVADACDRRGQGG